MIKIHVFDMDGTLFDTFAATKHAYEEAGITEYKPEYFGKTAREWNCPKEIHELKKHFFHEYRHMVAEGWAMPFYKTFLPSSAFILTGASESTVNTCRTVSPKVELRNPYGYGLNAIQKRRVLKVLSHNMGYEIFYYDDIKEIGERIVRDLDNVTLITEGDIQ